MTVSEFMFLAIGLVLGLASGAALIEVIRARPPARREIRLTVAPDAIPRRRPTTLADDAFVTSSPEPARGGPADRREHVTLAWAATSERRTNVLPEGGTTAPQGSRPAAPPASAGEDRSPGRMVGLPVFGGPDPTLDALQAGGRLSTPASPTAGQPHPHGVNGGGPVDTQLESGTMVTRSTGGSSTPVALLDRPEAAGPAVAPVDSGPCAAERRLADERCELATRAQAQATAAADALRRAQRAYDSHIAASTVGAGAADPRTVRSLKEDAQRAFRTASKAANSDQDAEAAARTWLQEINRINHEATAATLVARHERDAAAAVGATLERLSHTAEAARVGADRSNAACLEARTSVADCDERTASGRKPPRTAAPPPTEPVLTGMDRDEALGAALEGGAAPRIFRLLAGDPDAMAALVASLAGDDPDELRRWKLALSGLLDAIMADAIAQSFLRFPHHHPFWGPYTQPQQRDIARALASLGHRFDGLGGWADDRLPSQRELSLAVGYAGLDPMRVRQWPTDQQTGELFREVEVAADEYLAGAAGDLTLAEMVETLGRRADSLVDVWNQWGRIRPLLLEET